MEFNWFPLNNEQISFYRERCPDNEYRVFSVSDDLPGIPSGLKKKCSTIILAASGDANGRVFFMANMIRPDLKDPKGNALDQMPLGFVLDSQSPKLSGVLVQHGDWDERTTYPAPSAWTDAMSGKYEVLKDLLIMPSSSAGRIQYLNCASQKQAFSVIIKSLASIIKGECLGEK
jgi:hypothetical protein